MRCARCREPTPPRGASGSARRCRRRPALHRISGTRIRQRSAAARPRAADAGRPASRAATPHVPRPRPTTSRQVHDCSRADQSDVVVLSTGPDHRGHRRCPPIRTPSRATHPETPSHVVRIAKAGQRSTPICADASNSHQASQPPCGNCYRCYYRNDSNGLVPQGGVVECP